MAKTLHFSAPGAYHRWLAYAKMHGKASHGKPKPAVRIAGRPHRVQHTRRQRAFAGRR